MAWWVKERSLDLQGILAAVKTLPDAPQCEAAAENVVVVELVIAEQRPPE